MATAPRVVPGAQNAGNTSSGSWNCYSADYWNLPLARGDQATVDWISQSATSGFERHYASDLLVYPAGTDDFSVTSDNYAYSAKVQSNHHGQRIFSAASSGTFPLVFIRNECQTPGGPFSFSVSVKHSVVLSLGSVKSFADGNGSVTVRAETPGGQPITDENLEIHLLAKWRSKFKDLASTWPTNGKARFSGGLPKGTHGRSVRFKATADGADYLSAHTKRRTVHVRR